MPGLVFAAQYADYGKSDTLGVIQNVTRAAPPSSDATEFDRIPTWRAKQVKGLMPRTFRVDQTGEQDELVRLYGRAADATISSWRSIVANNV